MRRRALCIPVILAWGWLVQPLAAQAQSSLCWDSHVNRLARSIAVESFFSKALLTEWNVAPSKYADAVFLNDTAMDRVDGRIQYCVGNLKLNWDFFEPIAKKNNPDNSNTDILTRGWASVVFIRFRLNPGGIRLQFAAQTGEDGQLYVHVDNPIIIERPPNL